MQERDPDAFARLRAHATGFRVALSTAQLVIAREHGFAPWAQLKVLAASMASGGVRYDMIGHSLPSLDVGLRLTVTQVS